MAFSRAKTMSYNKLEFPMLAGIILIIAGVLLVG